MRLTTARTGLGAIACLVWTAALAVAQTPPPGLFDDRPPAPISLGTHVSGALGAGDKKSTFNRHYVDEFVIEGQRGDRIVLTLRSQAFAPRISVRSATKFVGVAQPAAAMPGEARLEATLPEDGRYIITASTDKFGEAGPYQLAVEGSSAGKAMVAAQVPKAPAASSVGPIPASSSSPDRPAQTQADWALWPAAPAAQRDTERPAVGLPGRMEWVTTDGLFAFVIPEGFKRSESTAGGGTKWKGAQGSCSVMEEAAFFLASFRPADQTTTASQSFIPAILATLEQSQTRFADTRPELAEIVPLAAGGAGRSLEAAFGVKTTNAGGRFFVTTEIMTAAEGATFGVSCIGTADNRAFLAAAVKNIRPLRRSETP